MNQAGENFTKVEDLIRKSFPDPEAKAGAWKEVDKIVNHQLVKDILDQLPEDRREGFMELFIENPNDEEKISKYLKENEAKKGLAEILSGISEKLTEGIIEDKEITTEIHSEGKVSVK